MRGETEVIGGTDAAATGPTTRRAAWVVSAGAALMATAAVLHVTGLSRAVAVAMLPFAFALLGAGTVAHHTGSWPSRPWRIAFAVLAASALAYGIALWVAALLTPALPA